MGGEIILAANVIMSGACGGKRTMKQSLTRNLLTYTKFMHITIFAFIMRELAARGRKTVESTTNGTLAVPEYFLWSFGGLGEVERAIAS